MMQIEVPDVQDIPPLQLVCGECEARTLHKVLSLVRRGEGSDAEYDDVAWTDYMVVACQGCESVSFCKDVTSPMESDTTPFGYEQPVHYVTQYPKVRKSRGGLTGTHLLPDAVHRIYRETVQAVTNDLPVLAAAGIRAIVETVCNEVGAKGPNLQARIDRLQELGTVTAAGADVLHKLRFMGNEAVHEVSPPTEEGLRAALDVVDYLLQGVYVIPKKAEQLPEGKQKS
ncbi:MAG: DUF4145 domain-containing protein [Planctomycetota bacterium]